MLVARSPRNESPLSPRHLVGTQDLPFGGQQVSDDPFFLPHCEEKVLQVSSLTTHSVMQLRRRQDNCQWIFCQSAKPTARRPAQSLGEGERSTAGKQSCEQALLQHAMTEQPKAFLSYFPLEEHEEFPVHDQRSEQDSSPAAKSSLQESCSSYTQFAGGSEVLGLSTSAGAGVWQNQEAAPFLTAGDC